jgi:DNA repair protein RecO (recombination protein O)
MSEVLEGIVIRSTAYGENRLIVNVFTENFGKIGLIATISKKGKGGLKKAYFQNLQMLEIVHASKGKGQLRRLQEARLHYSYQSLYFDPIKSCLSLFLSEFLAKVLSEENDQPQLFNFIKKALTSLDQTKENPANFHIAFLMEFSAHLGFKPQLYGKVDADFFDLILSDLSNFAPNHAHFIEKEELLWWQEIEHHGFDNWTKISLRNSEMRRQILDSLLDFFRLHLHDFGTLKSLSVLRDVLA